MDKYTLKTAFRKSFLGLVWRIEADTVAEVLAIETRDPTSGVPAFSVMRYTTGVSLLDEQPYGDRNWTLAGISQDKLILKALGQDRPNGAGIACLDIHSGKLLWEQFHMVLLEMEADRLVVRHRNFASGHPQYLDLDGNLTQFNTSTNKPSTPTIVVPERYGADTPIQLASYPLYGDLFHCRIGEKDVWAFHEAVGHEYNIRLVISQETYVLADEAVISGLAKLSPELFFAIETQLFFLGNNKREIASYLV